MSEGHDLTRWNRAGLSRFRYIDGNAAEWLESLRQALVTDERFPDWEAVATTVIVGESDSERLQRLRDLYEKRRGDLLWEITRSFARSTHVLTETMDAYANETYLQTATQWDNVRRLVAMLDYHPLPPASASTTLVINAKDGRGVVNAGFQIKHAPADGSAAVVFETLLDVDVDVQLNALRLAGWDQAIGTFASVGELGSDGQVDTASQAESLWLMQEDMQGLSSGQVAMMLGGEEASSVAMRIDIGDDDLTINPRQQHLWDEFPLAEARLLLHPSMVRSPYLTGERVLFFENPHGLIAGDIVAWENLGVWRYANVAATDDWYIQLEAGSALPAANATIYKMFQIDRGDNGVLAFSDNYRAAMFEADGEYTALTMNDRKTNSAWIDTDNDGGNESGYSYYVLEDDLNDVNSIFIVPYGSLAIGNAQLTNTADYRFSGGVGQLESGQWVVVEDAAGELRALLIDQITVVEDSFCLTFSSDTSSEENEIIRLYGAFKYELEAQGFDNNQSLLVDGELDSFDLSSGEQGEFSELIRPGRSVIIEQICQDGYCHAVTASVTAFDAGRLTISPPLDGDAGFSVGNTVIRGNVILAGHGKNQPERVLGSGDASRTSQTFIFKNDQVSFVADALMSSGVVAAIDVIVDGQIWQQQSSLQDASVTDSHYCVRMTEAGYIQVCFGDGEHGRRLPGGSNNVRIAWRKGSGLSGNLDQGKLEKPIKPHRLIERVRQPMASSGGSAMEAADSLRENAPASVLTLERAVSITDFKHLAVSHSSIWQASSFLRPGGSFGQNIVEVVVVPAGGGGLGSELAIDVAEFLEQHAMPDTRVNVTEFIRIELAIEISVQITTSEFDADAVKHDVEVSLLDHFSIQNRTLGQALYRSELFQVIEAVTGVENTSLSIIHDLKKTDAEGNIVSESVALIQKGTDIRRVNASQRELIFLADDGLGLTITHKEYAR